jgi:hypothetical protein
MSRDSLLQFAVFGLVAGSAMMFRGYRKFRVRRKIEDLPTSRIAQAAQGLVELQGKARPYGGKVFVASDGALTLYSRVTIEQYQSSGKNSRWVTRWKYDLGERFLIEDSTGVAHVIVKGAELHLEQETMSWDILGPERQRAFLLESAGKIDSPSAMSSGDWRVTEEKVTLDEDILVIGNFRTRSNEPELVIRLPGSSVVPERKVRSSGGLMRDAVHPLILADGTQQEVLARVNHGVWNMILGAAGVSIGFILAILEFKDFSRP